MSGIISDMAMALLKAMELNISENCDVTLATRIPDSGYYSVYIYAPNEDPEPIILGKFDVNLESGDVQIDRTMFERLPNPENIEFTNNLIGYANIKAAITEAAIYRPPLEPVMMYIYGVEGILIQYKSYNFLVKAIDTMEYLKHVNAKENLMQGTQNAKTN